MARETWRLFRDTPHIVEAIRLLGTISFSAIEKMATNQTNFNENIIIIIILMIVVITFLSRYLVFLFFFVVVIYLSFLFYSSIYILDELTLIGSSYCFSFSFLTFSFFLYSFFFYFLETYSLQVYSNGELFPIWRWDEFAHRCTTVGAFSSSALFFPNSLPQGNVK